MTEHRNFSKIPNCAFVELTPLELALYSNYVQRCRWEDKTGYCSKSNATLAKECQMSVSSVKKARQGLVKKSYIRVKRISKNKPVHVFVLHSIWIRNSNPSGSEKPSQWVSETQSVGVRNPVSGSEKPSQWVSENHNIDINQDNHQEVINQESSSKEGSEDLGTPLSSDDDDDFLNFDNLAIDGLFKTVFGREPKMTERHIIAQMLAEDCGNERLTMVLKRCIDLKIVPSSLNYIVTGFNNEKGKVIRIESVQPQDNWWADLIES